jgi:hypothetical protein
VSQKTKSADCLSARLSNFLVFLSTDLGSLRKSIFVLFVSQEETRQAMVSVPESDFFSTKNTKKVPHLFDGNSEKFL